MKLTPKAKDILGAAILIFAVFIISGWIWGKAEAKGLLEGKRGLTVTTGFAYEGGDTFGRDPVGVIRIDYQILKTSILNMNITRVLQTKTTKTAMTLEQFYSSGLLVNETVDSG